VLAKTLIKTDFYRKNIKYQSYIHIIPRALSLSLKMPRWLNLVRREPGAAFFFSLLEKRKMTGKKEKRGWIANAIHH